MPSEADLFPQDSVLEQPQPPALSQGSEGLLAWLLSWGLAYTEHTTREQIFVAALAVGAASAFFMRKWWHTGGEKDEDSTEEREEETEEERRHRRPLLQKVPPGSSLGRDQSLAWVRQTMQVDQEGDLAHDFLGPF
eukprot:g79886.t1